MKRHGQAVASNSIVSHKSVYVVLGIRTRGCTIVGADETTELIKRNKGKIFEFTSWVVSGWLKNSACSVHSSSVSQGPLIDKAMVYF